MKHKFGIGQKVLVMVGAIFVLFAISLSITIGTRSFENLTQIKQAELDRMSQILAGRIAEMEQNGALTALSFEENELIVAEIQLMTNLGPYYADPGSYFAEDFLQATQNIDDADQIYMLESQLTLIPLLQSTQQLNNLTTISFYFLPPYNIIPEATPILAFKLDPETISITQFTHKVNVNERVNYQIATNQFIPPPQDYFDISSAYSAEPEQFYTENNFQVTEDTLETEFFTRPWPGVNAPQSHIIIKQGVPIIQTWYPVKVSIAHPETWIEETVPVGIVVIEQDLNLQAITLLKNQLGIDVGFARDDDLLISTLSQNSPEKITANLAEQNIIRLTDNDFYYSEMAINFSNAIDANLKAVVLSPVSELAQLTQGLRSQIAWVTLITILLSGVIVYIIVQYLVNRPLGALMEGVELISEGDLNHTVNIQSQDELGQLATAFNKMATQLQELIESLEQRVVARTRRLEIIANLGERLNATNTPETLLTEVVNQVKESFNYYHARIFLFDDKQQQLILVASSSKTNTELQQALALNTAYNLVSHAAQTGEIGNISDVSHAENWQPDPLLPDTKAEMAVPLIAEEKILGVLDVHSTKKAGLDEGDANLLRSLANQIAIALTNATLFKQNQTALMEAEQLYYISQRMIAATNLSELIAAVVEEINIPVINRAILLIFGYDTKNVWQTLTVQANWYSGHGPRPTESGTIYNRSDYKLVELFFNTDPVFFANVQTDSRTDTTTNALMKHLKVKAMATLPLQGQKQQLGVLLLQGEEAYAFKEEEIRPYRSLLAQLTTAIENKHLLEQTQQRADELSKAKDAAEVANRAKSEFLANMSHELRTPLNGILGYTQILKRDRNLTPPQYNGLDIIQQSGEHLLTLINDILDLSKIEAGKMKLNPIAFNFQGFLENIAGIITMRANQKEIEFTYQADSTLPIGVWADETRLRQVLLNLLGNAVKFTDDGGVTFKVKSTLKNEVKNNKQKAETYILRFEVEDTGIGLTKKQLEKIFLPFEQAGDSQKQAEGTGLGLPISRKLVQTMGGDLQVKSTPNQGSLFWFEIELPKADIEIDKKDFYNEKIIAYKGPQLTILVVDDKAHNRSVMVNLLEPIGFKMIEAENGQEAVDKAQTMIPNLIVMDLVMPIMTGFEATQAIRQIPTLKDVVIIAASASVFDKDKQDSLTAGCDNFISKPININEFFTLLENHLNLKWVYETQTTETDTAPINHNQNQALIPPPLKTLNILLDLAMRGDMRKIQKQATDIKQMDSKFIPFANKIHQLAKTFNDKAILDLVEYFINKSN